MRLSQAGRARRISLVEVSPLRHVDPRSKLALALCASLAVMLSLEKLLMAMGLYLLLLCWARLLKLAGQQVWRLKWILIVLFVVDWFVVSRELAVLITLRLTLLAGSFTLFFATTTPAELRLALEWMRVPYRYAFSLSLAFQSLSLLDGEWRAIIEAQRSRGTWSPPKGLRQLWQRLEDLISLSVPAVVMTTKRAWAMTEAAYARGFDSPLRRPYRQLNMRAKDWIILALAAAIALVLMWWR